MFKQSACSIRRSAICLLFVILGINAFAAPFKLGSSTVVLQLFPNDCAESWKMETIRDIKPVIVTSQFFGEPYDCDVIPMTQLAPTMWGAHVDMIQPTAIVALRIDYFDYWIAENLLKIQQDETTLVSGKLQDNGKWKFSVNSDDCLNKTWESDYHECTYRNLAANLSKREFDLCAMPCEMVQRFTTEDFNDYKTVGRKFKEIFTALTTDTTGFSFPECVEPWFSNGLRYGYAGAYELTYRRWANEWEGIPRDSVPVYPDEYYSFLKEIDLSDEAFFTYSPVGFSPFYFSYQLLNPFNELREIGDMNPTEWKNMANKRLTSLGMNLTPNFIDFLLATAYLRQIREGTTLTPAQIQNVSTAFSDDLDKIILQKNDELVEVQKQVEIFDANRNNNRYPTHQQIIASPKNKKEPRKRLRLAESGALAS